MTDRKRPFIDVNPWHYEKEVDGSTVKLTPVQKDPDPRLDSALKNPATCAALVRCGSPKGCGRIVGQVFKTSEGLIALVYERRPDPFTLENRQLAPGRRENVKEEVEAVPHFLDGEAGLTLKCRHHGSAALTIEDIQTAAYKTRSWREPEVLWINRRVPR